MSVLLLLILAGIPLLGIAWIIVFGSITTVDGLFMFLILLTMSGIVGTTALFELRRRMLHPATAGAPAGHGARMMADGYVEARGKVSEVVFFESNVGEPNKSIVTIANGSSPQTLAIEGDMRNALPVGRTVSIILGKENGNNVLLNVSYS